MSSHSEALAQADRLSKISDENLVAFFAQELMRISKGAQATSLLNDSVIKNLTRFGVLIAKGWRGKGLGNLVVTDKGLVLLEGQ